MLLEHTGLICSLLKPVQIGNRLTKLEKKSKHRPVVKLEFRHSFITADKDCPCYIKITELRYANLMCFESTMKHSINHYTSSWLSASFADWILSIIAGGSRTTAGNANQWRKFHFFRSANEMTRNLKSTELSSSTLPECISSHIWMEITYS